MKYVATHRIKLVESIYNFAELTEVTADGLTKDIHDCYPAPIEVVIPNSHRKENGYFELTKISANLLQLLSIWYNRGTRIIFEPSYLRSATVLQIKHPRKAFNYEWVPSLPDAYLRSGNVTPDKAYAYGKKLIEACNACNLIPFDKLELGYKIIARQCFEPGRNIRVLSPNKKTIPEALAELQTAHDIEAIFDTTACTSTTNLDDTQLQFYARVFDIQMPEWYLRATLIRKNEISSKGKPYVDLYNMPFIDSTQYTQAPQFDSQGHIKAYDGNDFEAQAIPTSAIRDAQPHKLTNPDAERKQLTEQVMYFLNMSIPEQKQFMTSNYGYCDECHEYYELRDGCTCGHCKPADDIELACREYDLSKALY